MDNPVSVTVGYGKINLSDKSMSIACFKVNPPFARTNASSAGRVRSRSSVDATTRPAIGGGFSLTVSEFEEGTVILYQTSRSRRGSPVCQASVFLRLRKTAPLIRMAASLPHGPESVLGDSLTVFTGHADVLTYNELRVLGVEVAKRYRDAFMDRDQVTESFTFTTLAEGEAPRPAFMAVSTSSGVEVKAVSAEPGRRIRLRGK